MEVQFKILTFNVANLPQPISSGINGLRPLGPRVDEIINKIIEHYRDFDVLCFQEAFSPKAEQQYISRLSQYFPYISAHNGDHLIGVNSGLMILSKHPFKDKFFEAYPRRSGVDWLSRKGVLLVNFEKQGVNITVATTHCQAGGSFTKYWDWLWGNPDTITEWQLDFLNSRLFDFNQKNHAELSIFCGDLNVDLDREYNQKDHVSYGFQDQVPVNFPDPFPGTCIQDVCIKSKHWIHPTPCNECQDKRIDAMFLRAEPIPRPKDKRVGHVEHVKHVKHVKHVEHIEHVERVEKDLDNAKTISLGDFDQTSVEFRGESHITPIFGNASDHNAVIWEGVIRKLEK